MKQLLRKTAFVLSVISSWLVLVGLTMVGLGALMPTRPGPDGLYRSVDGFGFLTVIPMAVSLWIANRVASSLFCKAGISNGRWSLLARNGFNS